MLYTKLIRNIEYVLYLTFPGKNFFFNFFGDSQQNCTSLISCIFRLNICNIKNVSHKVLNL